MKTSFADDMLVNENDDEIFFDANIDAQGGNFRGACV